MKKLEQIEGICEKIKVFTTRPNVTVEDVHSMIEEIKSKTEELKDMTQRETIDINPYVG